MVLESINVPFQSIARLWKILPTNRLVQTLQSEDFMEMSATHASQSLFDFFNDLFTNLFFQPDDAVALKVVEDGLSEELTQKHVPTGFQAGRD